eukprot:763381-Hanusia_phi.AAC.2
MREERESEGREEGEEEKGGAKGLCSLKVGVRRTERDGKGVGRERGAGQCREESFCWMRSCSRKPSKRG